MTQEPPGRPADPSGGAASGDAPANRGAQLRRRPLSGVAVALIAALSLLGIPMLTLGVTAGPASASGLPTTTTIVGTTTSPVVGQPIVVSVSVSAASGTPTGSVTVSDGAGGTCYAALNGGSGGCAITETAVGSYSFTASYGGDSSYGVSNTAASTNVSVGQDGTVTTITDVSSDFVVGDPITIDVAVSAASPGGGTPTGDVTVSDGGSQTCDASLSGGTGSCQLTESASGSYVFTAAYNGDSNYTSSLSAAVGATEGGETSTTAIDSTTSNPVVGQPIEVDVEVDSSPPGGTPTGTVVVSDGGSQACTVTLSGGVGSCDITEAAAGSYSFTATYSGDSTYASSSTSSPTSVSVSEASTTTTITSTTPTPVVGQPIEVGVSVASNAPGAGTPTGTIQVSDGAGQTCIAELSDGSGGCEISESSAGGYDFSATYESDGNYASSLSGTTSVTVGEATTSTTITSVTPPSPVVGQAITVDVSVVSVAPGGGTPTGAVTVSDGGSGSCPVTLDSGGNGSCQITEGVAENYSLSAGYLGDGNYGTSTATAEPVTVAEANTSTAITSVTPSPVVGQTITVDVTVSALGPGSGIPTNQVEVDDGTGQTCMATLSGGSGSCPIIESTAGHYSFSATYESDGNYKTSTSVAKPVTVAAAGTSTTITAVTPSPVVGQPIRVTVAVASEPPGTGTPTGSVTVSDGSSGSCNAPLASGTGSCTITETSAGGYSFSASYVSDGNFAASASTTRSVTVGEAGTSTTITSVTPANPVVGETFTVDVSVASVSPGTGIPTGTVEVSDGASGSCVVTLDPATGNCQLTEAAAGGYNLSATYESDGNYASSTTPSTVPLTVAEAATTTRIVSATGSYLVGQPITVNVGVGANVPSTGTPTGTVTVSDGASQTCQATLSSGDGSCQITESSSGSYNFTASYASDGNYKSSASTAFGVTVGGDATTTSITGVTSSPVVGQPITISVSVAGTGTPTGTVTVGDGGSQSCKATLSGGAGSCPITETSSGSVTFTATYGGDSADASSGTGAGTSVAVGEDATTTSITSTTATPVVGQQITVNVSVAADAPGSGTPTNSVSVNDGMSQSCTANLTNGAGSCQITETTAQSYTLTATYQSDGNYSTSVTTADVTVGEAATSTSITSLPNNAVVGQPITIGVLVIAQGLGTGTPTNSVTVSDGTQSCVAALSSGAGNCQLTETTAGPVTFNASYVSDGNFAASSTTKGSQMTVAKAATTTSVTGTTPNPVVGQAITVNVAVVANAPGGGPPDGSVTVSDGGTGSCPVTLGSNGTGHCTIPEGESETGTYSFTATYAGSSNYSGSSTASGFGVSVSAAGTTTTVTSTTTAPVVGQPIAVHFSVAARSPGTGTPTGTVTVTDGETPAETCSGPLSGGSGSCSLTESAIGTYDLTATYAPGTNDNYSSSVSSSSDVPVGRASSETSLVSTTRVTYGDEGTKVSVTVAPEFTGTLPTGSITVRESTHVLCSAGLSAGKASCSLPAAALAAGSYPLVASYGGDSDFLGSTSDATTLTVVPELTHSTLSLSESKATYGDERTVKASVSVSPQYRGTTASGSVTIGESTVDLCTLTLSGGRGSCTLPAAKLGAGSFHLVAKYAGAGDFVASTSASAALKVEPATARTEIGTSHVTVVYGDEEAERLTVTVLPQYGGTTPTGSVTIADGRHVLCSIKLSHGRGSCSFLSAKLTAGSYHVVATYRGSADFKSSASRTATFNVARAGTHTAIGLTVSQVSYGREAGESFSVAVSSDYAGLRPPGRVVVKVNGSTLCAIALVSSRGSCTLANATLAGGGYRAVAVYEGSTDFTGSSSRTTSFGVSRAGTATSLRTSTSRIVLGDEERERISVSVSSKVGGVTANGSVTIQANGGTVCVIGLSGGSGSCALQASGLRPGGYRIRASYGGSADFNPSGSGSASVSVSKATSSTSLRLSASKVNQGNEEVEHFSVSVSPEFGDLGADGTVTVGTSSLLICVIRLSGGSGSCSLSANQLAVGTYHVFATYGGSSSLDGSTSGTQDLTVKFVLSVG